MVLVCSRIAHNCNSSLEQVDTIRLKLLNFVTVCMPVFITVTGTVLVTRELETQAAFKLLVGSNDPRDSSLINTIQCLHDQVGSRIPDALWDSELDSDREQRT